MRPNVSNETMAEVHNCATSSMSLEESRRHAANIFVLFVGFVDVSNMDIVVPSYVIFFFQL